MSLPTDNLSKMLYQNVAFLDSSLGSRSSSESKSSVSSTTTSSDTSVSLSSSTDSLSSLDFSELSISSSASEEISKAQKAFSSIKKAGKFVINNPVKTLQGAALVVGVGGAFSGAVLLPLGYAVAGGVSEAVGLAGFGIYKVLKPDKEKSN